MNLTGLEKVRSSPASFVVYPSPVSDRLFIRFKNSQWFEGYNMLSFFDVMGRQILSSGITDQSEETPVDVSALPEGVYLITITGDGVETIGRRIVVRW